MDWWFNCVAIEYGYPGENPTLLSRSPASSEIKTTFVIFSHSKTKFRTMAARIGKYSGCSQRRFRLVFCYYWVLQICLKNLCKSQVFSSKYFYGPRWRIKKEILTGKKIGLWVSICFHLSSSWLRQENWSMKSILTQKSLALLIYRVSHRYAVKFGLNFAILKTTYSKK